jgi:hypothetical protein
MTDTPDEEWIERAQRWLDKHERALLGKQPLSIVIALALELQSSFDQGVERERANREATGLTAAGMESVLACVRDKIEAVAEQLPDEIDAAIAHEQDELLAEILLLIHSRQRPHPNPNRRRAGMTEQFLLEWLAREDFSLYGECHGATLDALIGKGFVTVHHRNSDLMRCSVSVTPAGRAALGEGKEG